MLHGLTRIQTLFIIIWILIRLFLCITFLGLTLNLEVSRCFLDQFIEKLKISDPYINKHRKGGSFTNPIFVYKNKERSEKSLKVKAMCILKARQRDMNSYWNSLHTAWFNHRKWTFSRYAYSQALSEKVITWLLKQWLICFWNILSEQNWLYCIGGMSFICKKCRSITAILHYCRSSVLGLRPPSVSKNINEIT